MAKRFFIPLTPITHINGKIAPTRIKCPNTTDAEQSNAGYLYGYRHKNTPNKSFFGVRTASRHLIQHPYTTAENENKALFAAAVVVVNENLQIPANKDKCEMDFKRQNNYSTLRGFAIAAVKANGGQWLDDWRE